VTGGVLLEVAHGNKEVRAMIGNVTRMAGAGIALALMVTALWAWAQAWQMTTYATRPEVAAWAVRSAAVSAAAAAQLLILAAMARRRVSMTAGAHSGPSMPRLAIGLVGSVALVSAIALGLAGR
jgi:hypothetical protein